MKKVISSYYSNLCDLTRKIAVTDKVGRSLNIQSGFEKSTSILLKCAKRGNKLIFIGNGASASISSHMAADFWKNGRIKALSFNDAALLTCVSNDFGYDQVFKKPVEMFAEARDILVAISSSGKSENILAAVRMARTKKCGVITLSGFNKDNLLRYSGDINFYVPFSSYGHVEVIHHSICHCMLDTIVSTQVKE